MVSKAQNKATNKYVKETYDRIEVRFRREDDIPRKVQEHCEKYNYLDKYNRPNRSELFRQALETQMAIDRGEYKLVKNVDNICTDI